mmetsp:Transcript_26389/g.61241  ORF Transcript_26389/g.61241 Transcript_26389/m.61241 type:complete len:237 (+) Transcript_26389:1058-1768(+)
MRHRDEHSWYNSVLLEGIPVLLEGPLVRGASLVVLEACPVEQPPGMMLEVIEVHTNLMKAARLGGLDLLRSEAHAPRDHVVSHAVRLLEGIVDPLHTLFGPAALDDFVAPVHRHRHLWVAVASRLDGLRMRALAHELAALARIRVFLTLGVVGHLAVQQLTRAQDLRASLCHAVDPQLGICVQVGVTEDEGAFLHGVREEERGVVDHGSITQMLQVVFAAHGGAHDAHVAPNPGSH